MLRPTDRARLEALVESDDTAITPRDRIEAIKLLRGLGSPGDLEPGAIEMAAWAQSLSGEELDAALRD